MAQIMTMGEVLIDLTQTGGLFFGFIALIWLTVSVVSRHRNKKKNVWAELVDDHYEEEEAYRIRDEYLLGRDILVAPVLEEGAVSRSVYLPEDIWVDFWTKEEYRGGHYPVQAPLGRIPVFVRKGAALFG